jgi:anti-sigma B factor antagonist
MQMGQPDTPLEVKLEERPGRAILISPIGRIDSETYTGLEERVRPALTKEVRAVIFEMSGVNYISSAGLVVIFNTKKSVESNGGRFVIANLQPQVKKVFDIIKALPAQNIFESLEEADRYLSAIQRQEIEKQKKKT